MGGWWKCLELWAGKAIGAQSWMDGLFCWSVEDKNSMCGGDRGHLVKSPRELWELLKDSEFSKETELLEQMHIKRWFIRVAYRLRSNNGCLLTQRPRVQFGPRDWMSPPSPSGAGVWGFLESCRALGYTGTQLQKQGPWACQWEWGQAGRKQSLPPPLSSFMWAVIRGC